MDKKLPILAKNYHFLTKQTQNLCKTIQTSSKIYQYLRVAFLLSQLVNVCSQIEEDMKKSMQNMQKVRNVQNVQNVQNLQTVQNTQNKQNV